MKIKKGSLVRFKREVLNLDLDDNSFSETEYLNWIGLVLSIDNEEPTGQMCFVKWSDGLIRPEFLEYLEIIK
mgnify:FL=1|tara:strand:- start:11126 stop:11341 length:216 start_codon:yes stop_codon:yes gene_type:complete